MTDERWFSPEEALPLYEAYALAKKLTGGRLHIGMESGVVRFYRDGQVLPVKLLTSQMTRREIERVVAENGPWPSP